LLKTVSVAEEHSSSEDDEDSQNEDLPSDSDDSQNAESDGHDNLDEKLINFKSPNLMN
jgi:hypothetical protein